MGVVRTNSSAHSRVPVCVFYYTGVIAGGRDSRESRWESEDM